MTPLRTFSIRGTVPFHKSIFIVEKGSFVFFRNVLHTNKEMVILRTIPCERLFGEPKIALSMALMKPPFWNLTKSIKHV